MLRSISFCVFTAFISFSGLIVAQPDVSNDTASDPRSVILIIGDGFDDQHVTMGRNFLAGHDGQLVIDALPVRAAVQVQTVGKNTDWVYVADSANTATTLATGVTTQMGRVGTSASDKDLITIAQRAHAAGLKTGIVSSSSVTDATPASFMSHVSSRGCENPNIILGGELYSLAYEGCPQDATGNGGPGSIAEQIMKAPIDVVLGGGLIHFTTADPKTSKTALEMAESQSITVVTDPAMLAEADSNDRLIGLFASGHLPVRLQGSNGRVAEQPDTSTLNKLDWRLGSVTQPDPITCEPNPSYGNTPPLAELTQVALDRLTQPDGKGLFLMVESASIDKESHVRNPCGSLGEIAQLEEVVSVALNYAETHPQTLIIVTSDHAQAAQIIPEPSLYAEVPVPVYSPGHVARLTMPDGSLMTINYATNGFVSEEHTGANVPLFANDVGEGLLPAFLRQREVHDVMASFLGL
jgi:alkaline phosphatase